MKPDPSYAALWNPGKASNQFTPEKPVPSPIISAGYDPALAWVCSNLSHLVYKDDAKKRAEILLRTGLHEVRFFSWGGSQAFLVYSPVSDCAFLAFRGSSELKDWIANIEAVTTSWSKGGRVHKGFKRAFEHIADDIDGEVKRLDCPLILTGHSLGGALAVLGASEWQPMAVYAFASPPVGDDTFISTLKTPIYRHVHGPDVVPTLLRQMRHAGSLHSLKEITFSWWTNLITPAPPMRAHSVNLYSCAIERLI